MTLPLSALLVLICNANWGSETDGRLYEKVATAIGARSRMTNLELMPEDIFVDEYMLKAVGEVNSAGQRAHCRRLSV